MKRLVIFFALFAFPPLVAHAGSPDGPLGQAEELQELLELKVTELKGRDQNLHGARLRIAVVDLSEKDKPRYAHLDGDVPVYPASVVKFVYLIAAYKWKEEGRIALTDNFREEIRQMIGPSSNKATQKVFARLTKTEPGPELSGKAYNEFVEKRLAVKRWLESLGVNDLHTVHPTYDGNGDIFGRDAQFLGDIRVKGGLAKRAGTPANRQAMTALGTAMLLTLLVNEKLLTPENTAEVLQLMRRDIKKQPYQAGRIAGGAARIQRTLTTYSKTGTWGPIFADAGIVTAPNGAKAILVVFIEREPPYRGSFIADLSEAVLSSILEIRREDSHVPAENQLESK